MDLRKLCEIFTDEEVRAMAVSIGLSLPTTNLLRSARQAICGDPTHVAVIERKGKADGCACAHKNGGVVAALREAVEARGADMNLRERELQRGRQPWAATSRPIPGGQSGLGQGAGIPAGSESLCWNRRKDRGDLTKCEADKIARRKYPVSTARTSDGSLVVINTEAGRKQWDLEELGPGEAWYLYIIPPSVLKLSEVSQELGLFSWIFEVDGDAILPDQVLLAAERIWLRNGSVPHALQPWADIPSEAYQITKRRCRCVPEEFLCIPYEGRIGVAMAGPAGQSARMSITWHRVAIQIECETCEPMEYCDTPLLPRNVCEPSTTATDTDPCDDLECEPGEDEVVECEETAA